MKQRRRTSTETWETKGLRPLTRLSAMSEGRGGIDQKGKQAGGAVTGGTCVFLVISQQRKQHGRLKPAAATLTTSEPGSVSSLSPSLLALDTGFALSIKHTSLILYFHVCLKRSCSFLCVSVRRKQPVFPSTAAPGFASAASGGVSLCSHHLPAVKTHM